jgi:hypothetical protein
MNVNAQLKVGTRGDLNDVTDSKLVRCRCGREEAAELRRRFSHDVMAAVADENVTPLKVDRLDVGLDAIIPANATIERVATGFTWVEGPI